MSPKSIAKLPGDLVSSGQLKAQYIAYYLQIKGLIGNILPVIVDLNNLVSPALNFRFWLPHVLRLDGDPGKAISVRVKSSLSIDNDWRKTEPVGKKPGRHRYGKQANLRWDVD
jgi:hypothetical protein